MTALLKITVAFLLLTLLASPSHAQKNCLKFASSADYLGFKPRYRGNDIKAVFDKAGICIVQQQLPVKRIPHALKRGEVDGEYFRNKTYIASLGKNVVYVPTPVMSLPIFIISLKKSQFRPSSLADVKDEVIGYVKDLSSHQKIAKKIKNAEPARTFKNMASQLKAGRIDGLIASAVTLNLVMHSGFLNRNEIYRSYPVDHLEVFLILHKKHKGLITKLDQAIRDVKAEGGFSIRGIPKSN